METRWMYRTSGDLKELLEASKGVCLLPVGCVEKHGPHLPLGTDSFAGDALAYLRSGEKFDLIFLDPPYGSDLLDQALARIVTFDICRAHGIIVAESAADQVLPPMPAPYRLYREYRYGQIKLTVFHRDGNED